VAVAISKRKRTEGFICAVRAALYIYRERDSVLIIEAASEVPRLLAEAAARFRLSEPSQPP
jgi:hypothetical protein